MKLLIPLLLASSIGVLAACGDPEREAAAEREADAIEAGIEEAGDRIEAAADNAVDVIEDTTDAAEDELDALEDRVEEELDDGATVQPQVVDPEPPQ